MDQAISLVRQSDSGLGGLAEWGAPRIGPVSCISTLMLHHNHVYVF